MFTIEQRERAKNRLLEMARADRRIASAAFVGSTAAGGDRWSDLDITFGLASEAAVQDVVSDWTAKVRREFDAVHLFDLSSRSTLYRVFMFPGSLQVDLSFTPGAEFGARGPRFRLLFGNAAEVERDPPPTPQHLFGYAVHHLVRARICLERKKLWQAEYWISAARDYALALACLHRGLNTNYGRGFDELPPEVTREFADTLVGSLDRATLLKALGSTVDGLLRNSQGVGESATRLEAQLRGLASGEL